MTLAFPDHLPERPPTRGIDVVTTLRHFAIITYEVAPDALRAHLHERFTPDIITNERGEERALISVVPFMDVDFRAANWWSPRLRCGQTNYRAYVTDTVTGGHWVWFFGTCLDSWTNIIPRRWWKLPWHRGRIRFDCDYDAASRRYTRYRMTTTSAWSPAELELEDLGTPIRSLHGWDNVNDGMLILTHPLSGSYLRRDGALGSYSVWHRALELNEGRVVHASFPLLERLELVDAARQREPHSVMVQHETEFTVYLPPRRL